MREILFRGKRLDNGEWVEGGYFFHYGECRIVAEGTVSDYIIHYPVDSATVGQFTGLTDRNGKRIFEGDVVVFRESKYVVEWVEKYCRFSGRNEGVVFAGFSFDRCEAIGNIHDGGFDDD